MGKKMVGSSALANYAFQHEFPSHSVQDGSSHAVVDSFPRIGKVRINNYTTSIWLEKLESRFNELGKLKPGWDGYSGGSVPFSIARFSAELLQRIFNANLPPPSLVPGSDGSVQIEWHRNGYDIEIDVLAPFDVVAVRHDLRTGKTEELEIVADFTDLAVWINDLATPRSENDTPVE
jgi:hypothetical protein